MVPKKYREVFPSIAKQENCSTSVLEDLMSFYFKKVRKSLSDLDHHNIKIDKLGYFKIKHWKLDEVIGMYKKAIDKSNLSTFRGMARSKDFTLNVERIKRIQELLKEENKRKESTKKRRQDGDDKRDMEK